MSNKKYIQLSELCIHYRIEMTFFEQLKDYDLIEVVTIEDSSCISEEMVGDLEKMIRMHEELDLNFEGIDAVFKLLKRIEVLEDELNHTRSRLKVYEGQID